MRKATLFMLFFRLFVVFDNSSDNVAVVVYVVTLIVIGANCMCACE